MPANACMLLHRSMCTFPFPPCCRALGRPSSTSEATWRCTRDIAELEEKQRAAQLQLRVWKLGRIWLGLEALVSRTSPTTRSIYIYKPWFPRFCFLKIEENNLYNPWFFRFCFLRLKKEICISNGSLRFASLD